MAERTFEQGMTELMKQVPAAAKKGLARAGIMVLRDSVMEEPMVPLDEGTLRGSGSVHVDGAPSGTSQNLAPSGKGEPVTGVLSAYDNLGIHEVVIGFNTPYAAHLHEHPEYEFQHAGTGGKFLSSKLATNAKDYFAEVTDELKKAVKDVQVSA